ncbi:MAG: chemotaxis protein CheD [Rhodoferax sp.]
MHAARTPPAGPRPGARAALAPGAAMGSAELMPGDVALGLAADELRTLLGSCVGVILTDPRRTVGAMCHIVHVGPPNAANAHNTAYGEVAMRAMFARLQGVGIAPQRCHAFVYGGGNMFPALVSATPVGQRNVDWVLAFLAGQGIEVLDRCVGGCAYRRVWWRVGRAMPRVDNVSMEQGGFQ